MRRLTVEVFLDEQAGPPFGALLEKIEAIDVLSLIGQTRQGSSAVVRVTGKDPGFRLEHLLRRFPVSVHALEADGLSRTYYLKGLPRAPHEGLFPRPSEGFLAVPFSFRDGRLVLSYIGTAREVRGFLAGLNKGGFRYKVVSLMDARFSPDTPLANLTEKQRESLIAAFRLGYYDLPRRASTRQVARKLGLRESTFTTHRRKAERRLLKAVMAQTGLTC